MCQRMCSWVSPPRGEGGFFVGRTHWLWRVEVPASPSDHPGHGCMVSLFNFNEHALLFLLPFPSMMSLISSSSALEPCLEMSLNACEAGYAHRDKMSAMVLSFPGTYPTVRSNFDKI